jgi:hypothetical protein
MRDHRSPAQVIREWRLRPEREAAAAERRAERELRSERDGQEYSAARRAAAQEAEAHRGVGGWAGGGNWRNRASIVGAYITTSPSMAAAAR